MSLNYIKKGKIEMKCEHLLSIAVISLATFGCGDTASEKKEPSKPLLFKEVDEAVTREQTTQVYSYFFESTKDSNIFILKEQGRSLIKAIWTTLEKQGFSGYDPIILDNPVICDLDNFESYAWFRIPKKESRLLPFFEMPFHEKFIDRLLILAGHLNGLKKKPFYDSLLGLRWKDQYLYAAKNGEKVHNEYLKKDVDVYTYYLSDAGTEPDWANPKPSETMVTEVQLEEWNQVFINALKADPFFKQFFEPAALSDGSGSVSLLSARKGSTVVDTVALNVNGMSGSHVDLGLPMYVQLKGSVDHGKSTNLTTGTVAYKLGNTVVGAIQSYANSGTGFGSEGRQLETSVVASHSFGSFFIEGQLGSVSATDVRFKDWSGVRSQLTLGLDTAWVSPFVQLTHRDFGNTTDTATYAGFQMDISELNADTYAFSTHLFTKIGPHSVHGITGIVEWSGSLNLNSGVSFTTNLSLGTAVEPSAGLNFTLDR
jgi:hypothetical protein